MKWLVEQIDKLNVEMKESLDDYDEYSEDGLIY